MFCVDFVICSSTVYVILLQFQCFCFFNFWRIWLVFFLFYLIELSVAFCMLLPLRPKSGMLLPLRPKSGTLRRLQLKMSMSRLCVTEMSARPKKGILRPLRLKIGKLRLRAAETFAPPRTRNHSRSKALSLKTIVTQKRCRSKPLSLKTNDVQNHCHSKWVCCNFAQLKKFFATLREPKQDMLRLSATQKRYDATVATQNGQVATLLDRNLCATTADKKFLQFCATQKQYVAIFRNQSDLHDFGLQFRVEVCNLHFE